jgi:hypothetical protein
MTDTARDVARCAGEFRDCGATAVYLFGSRARGDHSPESDIDLFIDYDASRRVPSLFKIMELESTIGRSTGVAVHITTRDSLHPLMKDNIERDAVRLP